MMEANKAQRTSSGQQAGSRHIQTEQRRRDRINEGFEALRELIPSKDKKMDKATFLLQVVEYIRTLQETVQQVVAAGGINTLPEETQWQVRLLLPRRPEATGASRDMEGPPTEPLVSTSGGEGTAQSSESPRMYARPSIPQQQAQEPVASTSGRIAGSQQAGHGAPLSSDTENRTAQLQALLQQLQAQQAVQQQQLQSQQAAAIQSQMMTAMRIQQLLQQHPQLAANAGLSADALRLPAPPLTHPLAQNSLAASQLALLLNQGLQQQAQANQSPQDTSCGTSGTSGTAASQDARGASTARKASKVRRHTTAARIPKPHRNPPSSGSEGSRSGRPDIGEAGFSDVEA